MLRQPRKLPSWLSLALWILITHFLTLGFLASKGKSYDLGFSQIISTPEITHNFFLYPMYLWTDNKYCGFTPAFLHHETSLKKKKEKVWLFDLVWLILAENKVEISFAAFRDSQLGRLLLRLSVYHVITSPFLCPQCYDPLVTLYWRSEIYQILVA